jgi:membrane-associated phospholipid phosphatase
MGKKLSKITTNKDLIENQKYLINRSKKFLKNLSLKLYFHPKYYIINLFYKYPSFQDCQEIIKISHTIKKRKEIVAYYDLIFKNIYRSIYYKTDQVAVNINDIVTYYTLQQKIKFNALRPETVCYKYNLHLDVIDVKSAHTPSFPSGHTVQYYTCYLYFSTKFPHKKDIYYNHFINGSNSRVVGGLHFFEDLIQGVVLVNELYRQSNYLRHYINKELLLNPNLEMFYNNIYYLK